MFRFGLMHELGYPGWVGCEYRPRGETVAGLGWARRYGIGRARARRRRRGVRARGKAVLGG